MPVVSTRVGNVPELLDFDDRFLSPSKDPEKLAEGIRYVYENKEEMKALIQKNRERVFQFYDRDTLFDTYRNLYLSVGE